MRWIKLTDDDDTYVPRFGWIREGWAWAEVLNRKQDTLDLYFIDTQFRQVAQSADRIGAGCVDKLSTTIFASLKSGDRFLWTSWRDGHTHIYLYSFNGLDPIGCRCQT